MLFTAIGLACVIAASYILDDAFPQQHLETHVYSFLMFASTLAYSIQRTWEEKLLSEIEVSSRRFVGLQGLFGMLILLIFQAIFSIVMTSYSNPKEPLTGALEVISHFKTGPSLIVVSQHTFLWLMTIVLVVAMTINEYSGMIVTKRVSCTFRTIIENSKVLFVWIFEVIYVDLIGKNYSSKHYVAIFLIKLLGYLFVIVGSLVVNEYIKIPYCRMDKYHGNIYYIITNIIISIITSILYIMSIILFDYYNL